MAHTHTTQTVRDDYKIDRLLYLGYKLIDLISATHKIIYRTNTIA